MLSEQVMSSGVFVVEVWADLLSCGQVEVRAELSDGSVLQLNRTDEDLAQMMKRLVDDREMLSSNLLTGLLKVRGAEQSSDPQMKVVEVNKLLKTIINLPHKFSQSEAVLAFFEPSAVDRTFRQEEDQTFGEEPENQTLRDKEDQDLDVFQSPVDLSDRTRTIGIHGFSRSTASPAPSPEDAQEGADDRPSSVSVELESDTSLRRRTEVELEILRSNGFCLANTETILFDQTPPTHPVTQSDDSSGRRDDGQTGEKTEFETQVSPAPLSHPLHLLLTWAQETDILD
ncbi:PX domain-containing protein 1-like isoform X2 [Chaetodon trifascialis]|uniref:PX domain-containing protein 1-like isoform X2 n=1 Tax=Chaetodon trifascialis TaxID=109706 RepID=UPI0039945B8C